MPKYRLKNIPRDVFEDAVRFCDTHAQVPRHQMLQKLTILDFVIPLLPAGDESTILEIGAGLGIHAALLSHYGRVACTELRVPGSFIGADREIDTVRRELFEALGNGPIDFSFHDGRRLPYPDATFDIVFHNSVIEHVPDVVAFNREVGRVLKPGGLCICITGTPTLCWFRLVKHFVFRLPVLLAVVAAKEAIPRRWGTTVVNGVVRAMRLPQSLGRKLLDRLTRLDERLQSVAPTISAGAAAANIDVRSLYSRLYHFVYFPEYNRVVIEKAAADLGCTTDQLLSAAANHFKRSHRRMSFDLAPATHGQHYKGVWHEMREWRLERWQEQFAAADLRVEHIIGYRYHQLLEATPSDRLNSWLYYLAAPRIHEWIRDGSAPERASEIIITARRPA